MSRRRRRSTPIDCFIVCVLSAPKEYVLHEGKKTKKEEDTLREKEQNPVCEAPLSDSSREGSRAKASETPKCGASR